MRNFLILFSIATLSALSAGGVNPNVDAIADRMKSAAAYSDSARFIMAMPTFSNDVAYDLGLRQRVSEPDSLAPCSYVVRWTDADRGRTGGFTAYFDGNFFRFDGKRLNELHATADTASFSPSDPSRGVQQTAQFANLLPAFIGTELKKMASDPEYTLTLTADTVIDGRKVQSISAIHVRNGFTARRFSYVLDPATSLPLTVEIVNNPDTDNEQSISVTYSGNPRHECAEINETTLSGTFPDAFGRFRAMTPQRMVGNPLPEFSLPTTTGERYTRSGNDPFRRPTIMAVIDDTSAEATPTVEALREAVAKSALNPDLILAFTGNNIDRIESHAPDIRQGEHLLTRSRALAREFGMGVLPTILICDSDATVKGFISGYNNHLASDVIQKMETLFIDR